MKVSGLEASAFYDYRGAVLLLFTSKESPTPPPAPSSRPGDRKKKGGSTQLCKLLQVLQRLTDSIKCFHTLPSAQHVSMDEGNWMRSHLYVIVSLGIAAALLMAMAGSAMAVPPERAFTSRVTVIALGWNDAIAHTTGDLERLLPFAGIVKTESLDSFASWMMREGYGTVVLVGHGVEEGIVISGELVLWDSFGAMLQDSPAHTVLLAACYSQLAGSALSGKEFFGFSRLVDVDEAAYLTAAMVYGYRGNTEKIRELFGELFDIMVEKLLETSDHPRLTLWHNPPYTKRIRGTWHVRHSDVYGFGIEYTHPDTYVHYPWIGYNWGGTLGSLSNNLAVGQLKKSDLDAGFLAGAISTAGGIISAVIAALIGSGVGAPIAAILAGVLLLAGLALMVFTDFYVRDESGAGWVWFQNVWQAWYGRGFDMKIGGFMWIGLTQIFGIISLPLPLWYGWEPWLGIDGW